MVYANAYGKIVLQSPSSFFFHLERRTVMPEYIWDWVCHNELDDGEYKFKEGIVIVKNGYVNWKAE